jgi:hypothetical protein
MQPDDAAVNVMGRSAAAYAEPDDLHTLPAVIDASALRADSAIWPPWNWIRATGRIVSRPKLGSE